MSETLVFEGWAILELMGHRRLGGYLSEATIGGGTFIRIDVPSEDEAQPAATQFYSPSSVYCVTPTTEELARAVAVRNRPTPVTRFELPAPERDTSRGFALDDDDDDLDGAGF